MPRISWVLLLAAILVATVTVVVMASAGPAWPQTFATCGGDGILAAGSAARDRAIADWHEWWLGVYLTGCACVVPLAAAWARAAGWRPSRRAVTTLAAGGLITAALVAIEPDVWLVAVAPGILWGIVLRFPDGTPLIASIMCAATIALAALAASALERRGQAITQRVLAGLLISAWIGLLGADMLSNGVFAC